MSLRRSIAAAVFVAAVSAPAVLGATPALADTAPTPTPTGQSQPDAPVTDVPAAETPAAETPATDAPVTETPATEAPATDADAGTGSAQEEAELRARLARVIAEPGHNPYFYEHANAALSGTVEDVRHFLDVEMARIVQDEKRLFASRIMSMTDRRGQLWQTLQNVFDGTDADLDHFLDVTWPAVKAQYTQEATRIANSPASGPALAARAQQVLAAGDRGQALVGFIEVEVPEFNNANWKKVLGALIRPGGSGTLDEVAEQVLGADGAKAFLDALDGISDDEARLRISQAMSVGGPEVCKAAGAVMDSYTSESLRAFLRTGLAEAQARDTANAQQPQGGNGGSTGNGTGGGTGTDGGGAGATVTPASNTTGTTTTTTTAAQTGGTTSGTLAFTGADAPLGAITAVGASAVALGTALVAARRRRQQQS
ncbi:hypothetical protein ACIQF6_26615 [Kitasatospora sp. NPDC092948]|uniref:hypothetical protein n=1 Tax=Kitasatospora sp. NPDC092948 TaxID=3364088 RepID=UPI00380DBD77